MSQVSNEIIAMKVSRNTLIINIVLSAVKLLAGLYANSSAMVSDAAHSASDALSTIVVIIGVKMAGKKSDKEHPYGHERLECAAAIILAALLFATGASIGITGGKKLLSGSQNTIPGMAALMAAVCSIAIKEGMYWYTKSAAKKAESGALMADAWHHRSDSLSSLGSFAGILGARMGFPLLDPLACVIIALLIIKVSVDIFRDAISKMTDRACDDAIVEEIRSIILSHDRVMGIDQIKTRIFGDKIYVDVEISENGDATLYEAHNTALQVHDAIEKRFPKVKHCMVHVNPFKGEE